MMLGFEYVFKVCYIVMGSLVVIVGRAYGDCSEEKKESPLWLGILEA